MVVTVIPGHRGRQLFDGILDPRVRVFEALTDAMPDLIAFPCGQDRRFEKARAIRIPANVQRGISEGRIGLVFDASTEGVMHKPDLSDALHEVIEHLHAQPERCIYVTQERNYRGDYLAHCARSGRTRPAGVLVHDYWIWDSVSHYADTGEEAYAQRLATFQARPAHRARRFLSLNRTARPIKVLFLLRLLHDALWDSGFISFGGFRGDDDGPGKPRPSRDEMVRSLPGFEDLVDELMPQMDRLAATGRQLLGMDRHGWSQLELWNAGMAADLAEYADSWFSVVTETEMRSRPSRITEKTLKPLVNFHPLILFANPGSLRMIREYGFVTFENVIDESYDEELDPRRRFDKAYSELERLCRLDERALRQMQDAIEDRLLFNAHWGLGRMPVEIRRTRDAALVDTILDMTGLAAHETSTSDKPSFDA